MVLFFSLFKIVQAINAGAPPFYFILNILNPNISIATMLPMPVPYVLYCSIFHSSGFQATVGEYIMGIKIVDLDGNKISFGKAMIYNFCRFLATVCMAIGLFLMIDLSMFGLVLFLCGIFALFYLGKVLKVGRMLRNLH
tara:strand:- start:151 stop:567 length:417 start_codon:yes stop_codon:yes gene_type:complete